MRIVIAGAHGQIARQLTRRLAALGDEVTGLVRNPDHVADVEADAGAGGRAVVLDLESASVDELVPALEGADAVVFAAGAGPGSGDARKKTVDQGAAVLLADAAVRAGVRRYLLVSSVGVEAVRDLPEDAPAPEGVPDEMVGYLRAKLAAEDDVRSRDALDWTVLRPGPLTDDPATGSVALAPSLPRGEVTRDDVAAVVVALLQAPSAGGLVLELSGGDVPVAEAVEAVAG